MIEQRIESSNDTAILLQNPFSIAILCKKRSMMGKTAGSKQKNRHIQWKTKSDELAYQIVRALTVKKQLRTLALLKIRSDRTGTSKKSHFFNNKKMHISNDYARKKKAQRWR